MHDIFVIGGGINGCGIARDAAGRGLSVYLAEKADLASGTSSSSTKLIHGGLRYLEHFEFRLVRESLQERETLLRMAPHIVWPMRFVLPHHTGLRPKWLIRIGLFLYDHLGGRELLAKSQAVRLADGPLGAPLKTQFRDGFEYSDCWVDDARLVLMNAMDARDRGATIRTRTEVISAHRTGPHWSVTVRDLNTGQTEDISARVLINAAGPWASEVAANRLKFNGPAKSRLVRGSHIVVRRLFDHDRAYIFQNEDGRIIFAIPYEQDFTLIGTTDVDVGDDPDAAEISGAEIGYLLDAVGEYFTQTLSTDDVVWTYSGIRPLFDDGEQTAQEITRDYVLNVDAPEGQAPLLNIFGGKITTYRHLAEETLAKLSEWLPSGRPAWTSGAQLPGGQIRFADIAQLPAKINEHLPALSRHQAERYARTYGTLPLTWAPDELGDDLGAGLMAGEVRHLMASEWAQTAEDVLWRRTKLGLRLTANQAAALEGWMAQNRPANSN